MLAESRSGTRAVDCPVPTPTTPGFGGASATRPAPTRRRRLREPVNSLTHLAGAVFAVVVTVLLIVFSGGGALRVVAFALFGASSIALFTASTLLHAVHAGPTGEQRLRRLDHAAIFVLIAGTYTPITLVAMQPWYATWGWVLFGVAWGVAFAGVVFKMLWIGAPRWLSTGLYLAMGWLVIVAVVPVARSLGAASMTWLGVGGAFYTVGAIIYATKRPNLAPGVFGFHELWHLFVLAGWAAHVVVMFRVALAA